MTSKKLIPFLFAIALAITLPLAIRATSHTTNDQQRAAALIAQPQEGVYEGCRVYDPACIVRLQTIARGGFTVVLNYNSIESGSAQQIITYANAAQAAGVKIIWSLKDRVWWDGSNLLSLYPQLATTCNCATNKGFITYIVNLVKNHPATWGYYIGDEVAAKDHDAVKTFSKLVHQVDRYHPRLLIESADGATAVSSVSGILSPFGDSADIIGDNFYPVGSNNMQIGDTGKIASEVQQIANHWHRQSAMVLQSFSWSQYPHENWRCGGFASCPFPMILDMQEQLLLTSQNAQPSLILWYSYFDILRSDNPAQHWTDLTSAISGKQSVPTATTIPQITSGIPTAPTCLPMPPQCKPGSKLGIACPQPPSSGWCPQTGTPPAGCFYKQDTSQCPLIHCTGTSCNCPQILVCPGTGIPVRGGSSVGSQEKKGSPNKVY